MISHSFTFWADMCIYKILIFKQHVLINMHANTQKKHFAAVIASWRDRLSSTEASPPWQHPRAASPRLDYLSGCVNINSAINHQRQFSLESGRGRSVFFCARSGCSCAVPPASVPHASVVLHGITLGISRILAAVDGTEMTVLIMHSPALTPSDFCDLKWHKLEITWVWQQRRKSHITQRRLGWTNAPWAARTWRSVSPGPVWAGLGGWKAPFGTAREQPPWTAQTNTSAPATRCSRVFGDYEDDCVSCLAHWVQSLQPGSRSHQERTLSWRGGAGARTYLPNMKSSFPRSCTQPEYRQNAVPPPGKKASQWNFTITTGGFAPPAPL